jgi:enoyl-[acyl-carrier-protein] reductase (NADH)
MLLDGKRLLLTGVLTDDSIAYAVAEPPRDGFQPRRLAG